MAQQPPRMEFDPNLYKELKHIGEVPSAGNTQLRVAIFQYADSPPKIRFHRVVSRRDHTITVDPKGITASEAAAVGKLLAEAAEEMSRIA